MLRVSTESWHQLISDILDSLIDSELEIQTYFGSSCHCITKDKASFEIQVKHKGMSVLILSQNQHQSF